MKTVIKIAAALAFVPMLVGCSSASHEASASDTKTSYPCPFTAAQMKLDSADQKEIAEWREYVKTGIATERIVKEGMDRKTASLLVATYDTAMIPCKK
jgi:hypothetical protein